MRGTARMRRFVRRLHGGVLNRLARIGMRTERTAFFGDFLKKLLKKTREMPKAFLSHLANFGKICYNTCSGVRFCTLGTINMKKYGLSRRNPPCTESV